MDAAPRAFDDLPLDEELGVHVPFACGTPTYGDSHPDRSPTIRRLDQRRVTQCALSRVCGVCGAVLGRPLAFVGSPDEADRNGFHLPACHLDCANALIREVSGLGVAVLGQSGAVDRWVLATASAFEYVRPGRDDADHRPTFQPHAVLSEPR